MAISIPRRPSSLLRLRLATLSALLIFVFAYAPTAEAQTTRGPYLQNGSATAVTVRWRTAAATNSRVRWGTVQGSLTSFTDNAAVATEHEVRVTGLAANTKYFYSVGSTTATQAGNDANHFFITSPSPGTPKNTRIWVLGDAGTGSSGQTGTRDAYYNFTGTRHTDLWLMLGDNAYSTSTDAEMTSKLFNIYPTMLRKSVLFATRGNHESATNSSGVPWHYVAMTNPTAGEAGGLASGTEAYYAVDYGNIHLVCLDSFGSSRSPSGAMATWLRNDLAANDATWTIAFFHHPPYSKGSHNSDTESQLIEMRTNILPILEQGGVDMVLAGHSHAYERTFLLDGHYGSSGTLTPAMKLNAGDGREGGGGAYKKAGVAPTPHEGAVYVVAGSSGQASGGSLNHPAMYVSFNRLGSMVLDVNGNRLDARFLRETGAVDDSFTILKGVAPGPGPTTFVGRGASWKYLDNGSNQGTAWRAVGFNDTAWASGPAELGYGDGDEATVISYGPNSSSKYITSYFRKSFTVTQASSYTGLSIGLRRDDGAVVYINGTEAFRTNMPTGTIAHTTLAGGAIGSETTYFPFSAPASLLVEGTNVIAVEVHQSGGTSSDVSFDLDLIGNR